jgi:hypothetical protein
MDRTKISPRLRSHGRELASRLPHRVVLGAALWVGVTGNLLVQGSEGPGLNMFLFFITLALGIGGVTRLAGCPLSREAWLWVLGGIVLSTGLALRASPPLQFLAFFAASAAFTFPALRAGAAWMRGSGVSDHIEALVGAVGYAGFGAFRVAADLLSSQAGAPGEAEDSTGQGVSAVLRGLLLAAPLLLVFGALFVSADRVFADLVSGLLGTAFDQWASHLAVTGILAWLATGYLTGFLHGTHLCDAVKHGMRRPSIGIVEVGVALGLIALLFTAFIAVQFRYLFGGSGLVEVTPGLSYSEYAREGFGQLALAAALVLPTLLISDWLLRRPSPRGRRIFRALGSLQLLLLVLLIASAFQRVRAYLEAYGLTESRFYGVVFLAWLTLLSIWFGATVLRGRRKRFAFPTLLSAFAVVAALFIANPDAWIARTNLTRSGVALDATALETAMAGARDNASWSTPDRPAIDAAYLASLSADAVPTLLRALPDLPLEPRCDLARHLMERWDTGVRPDWRSWNRAFLRAREVVRSEASELRSMIGEAAGCLER